MIPLRLGLSIVACVVLTTGTARADDNVWKIDVGLRWFKYSADPSPPEVGQNRVFDRWESIEHDRQHYAVSDYHPLKPLYFNFSFGADVMIRYKRHLMLKLGYDYSNPLGIGGEGDISYSDVSSGTRYEESKSVSYTSHMITTFLGPAVPIGDAAEIYMGFSPMAPTWVTYHERYSRRVNGQTIEEYDRTWHGFFGNCRALVGIQINAWNRFKVGTELVWAFLNYMKLTSGEMQDSSFRFPNMMFNIAVRYQIY